MQGYILATDFVSRICVKITNDLPRSLGQFIVDLEKTEFRLRSSLDYLEQEYNLHL